MKLIKDIENNFIATIIINNQEYINQIIKIKYYIKNNKYYYLINTDCNELINFFNNDFIEGVKGYKQHIISNDNFHLIYKEKNNQLELITINNSVFIFGKLILEDYIK